MSAETKTVDLARPYPFINPATAGWGSVVIYIVALSAVIIGLVAFAVAYSRLLPGRQARHAQA